MSGAPDPVGPVTIGAREIYDLLVDLRGQVSRLADQHAGTTDDVKDHEARIRSLERRQWPLPTLAVLVSVAAIVVAALPHVSR